MGCVSRWEGKVRGTEGGFGRRWGGEFNMGGREGGGTVMRGVERDSAMMMFVVWVVSGWLDDGCVVKGRTWRACEEKNMLVL